MFERKLDLALFLARLMLAIRSGPYRRFDPVSTAIEFWSNVGVENSPLQFDLVAPVAAGRLNGGEFAEVEFDHVLERLCRGSLAEAVG